MLSILALAFALGAEPFAFEKEESDISEEIREAELKAHVHRLASPEFLGRRGPGAARAARHIADAFDKLKLQPAFGGSFLQPIPKRNAEGVIEPGSFIGNNVAAILPGVDPELKDEWIVLSCHLDHLGKNGDKLFPGADDNASGCAMLLEAAECFALRQARPRRTIVFIAFDQEEPGLFGSKHFVDKPPRDLKKLKAFMTADLIGRSMANLMDEYVFVLGSESSPQLRALAEKVQPKDGLKAGRIGADMIGTRSDYGPFRDRQVPYLFFSTGQHPDYHKTTDTADRIDYPKLCRISRWIFDLTAALADTNEPPVWAKETPAPDIAEVRVIHLLLSRVLESPKKFPLSETQRKLVQGTADKLDGILKRGTYTQAERSALLLVAKIMMSSVF